ncbi:TPA: hypothetical protein RPW15_001670 [Campylobacter fetus subsp. venerealis]|uniref:Uncharacterized protein n=1 Tax=Campylobacter fetus subsp. venerealis NCTC 10354 TaxID=983328 RepID=A0AAE6IXV3_CAMFE|nr:hypothetical protein [Campylobacter fetus]OCS25433.1 hypothetical protein CFVB10_08525 [Campylobacter fetus subsp. venerealis cfvB10]OCS29090.1 hypothetical protein CFVCCUG33900_08295 [Campylobacter fetus subsp. venerealis LMG 6570 = CCUG 33900]AIR80136.1 hypothetical protein CFV97608_0472 [Campylobacter fetus subsp. venerealis 97/608]EAK0836131.1 hypothetical protein [Campylobacter fetus]EGU23660.1 Hypothetical protein CFV354_0576 [Campylobacter fetus subsp. venerealis NCTC 10354]
MYFEGSVSSAPEFLDVLKAKALEAGYESVSDRTLDVTNVNDYFDIGGFETQIDNVKSGASRYLNTAKDINSSYYDYQSNIIFTKDVLFKKIVIKNYLSTINGEIIGINEDNSTEKITDIVSATNPVTIESPTNKKYRGIHIKANGQYRVDITLENGSYIYRELILRKSVGNKELLYMFILEDYGDKYFLHMSPLKSFNENKKAIIDSYAQIGAMPNMAIAMLNKGVNNYYISLQDRRICGAFSMQNGNNITWQPFYIGLLRPYGEEISPDPFLCFASGTSRVAVLASKEHISLPYAKYNNEYQQCITHPCWAYPPTKDNLYGDLDEPFCTPLIVCYFGKYNGSSSLGSTIQERARALSLYSYKDVESKLLGDMDGIIAIILGSGVSVGDDVSCDGHNYKIVTAGNELISPYCYAIIKE